MEGKIDAILSRLETHKQELDSVELQLEKTTVRLDARGDKASSRITNIEGRQKYWMGAIGVISVPAIAWLKQWGEALFASMS